MNIESGKRGNTGVVLSIFSNEDGRIRLVIDDVVAESNRWPQEWRSHVFVTHNDYARERFLSSELTDSELSEIGATVVARLAATFKGDR